MGLVGQEPVTELRVVAVGVEQGIRPVRHDQFGIGDRAGTLPVVGLPSDVEYPARHRDGDTVGGQLAHERVEPFPGRFACDRYAVARRRTSFSCSSSLIRLRASRSSAESFLLTPGLTPLSVSAWRSQVNSVIGWIPKSLAICSTVTPGSRSRATRTTSSRNSRG